MNEFKAELCRRKFKHFVKATMPTYEFNWHQEYLCSRLDDFISGKVKRLMVFMPPQHGKSQLVSRHLPAYLVGKNPNCKTVISSYSGNLASGFNRDAQRIIAEPVYNSIFPETLISNTEFTPKVTDYKRGSDQVEIMNFSGYIKSVGVTGSLTGNPADVIIIDDPVKDMIEAESEVYRARVWDWYTSVAETRIHNDSLILLTMTRWHHDDLAGRLIKFMKEHPDTSDKWEIVIFPAIKEDESNPDDPRNLGEALWPQRHSLQSLIAKKSKSDRVFTSLYQQRPGKKSGNIWKNWFLPVDDNQFPHPSDLSDYGTDWDLAYTKEESNSASAFVTAGKIGSKMYIDRVGYAHYEFPELIKWMKTKPRPHFVEAKASGKSAKQTLLQMGVPAIEVQVSGGDKVARAQSSTPFAEAGMVYIRKSQLDFLLNDSKQGILAFPNNLGDDLADSLAQSVQRLLGGDDFW